MKNIKFLFLGFIFGIILVKSEVISWFRIQEMFRFQAFHMYGIIGSAVVTGIISTQLIKRFNIKSFNGNEVNLQPKPLMFYANLLGGTIFGLGWAMTGACPGPIYALIGHGLPVFIVVLVFAYLGAFVYGMLRKKLPH